MRAMVFINITEEVNKMKHHDINWDKQLQEIPFYKKCNEMRPFIGCNYKEYRTLLVCQSYGVDKVPEDKPDLKQINNDPETWYNASKGDLDAFLDGTQSRGWIDPRELLGKNPSHIWHKVADAIIKGEDKAWGNIFNRLAQNNNYEQSAREYVYSRFALMNFFTRPVTVGNKFTSTDKDNVESYKTFTELVEIIEPKHIIFLGKEAHNVFDDQREIENRTIYNNIGIDFTNSPLSGKSNWWADDDGENKFLKIIHKNQP